MNNTIHKRFDFYKKFCSIFLILCMVINLFSGINVYASEGDSQPILQVDKTTAKLGDTNPNTYTVTYSAGDNGTLTAAVSGAAISTGAAISIGAAINSGASVAQGNDIIFTATPSENYQVKEWEIGNTAVADNRTNTLTVSNLQTAIDVTVEFEKIAKNIEYPVDRQTIEDALDKATNVLVEKFDDSGFNYQQHWMSIAINGFGKTVPGSYLEAINKGDMPANNSGQYGKYILGILAAGGDPTNINGRNLLAELCQLDDMKNVSTEGSIYSTPFGLLALDAVNYKIPSDAGFTRDDIINALVKMASPTGDTDGVGFVLTALGKYYNEKPAVKEAVDKVVAAWAAKQGADGGFGAGQWSKANNANTAAQVLMGLSFNGIDPQSEQFTKAQGNLVSFILSLQNEDGTFNWQKDNAGSISMATEQATYALDQYLRQLDGKKSIYDFTGDKTAPVISTDLENKTVNTSAFTFTVSANDQVDGAVLPVVKLDSNTVKETNGTYTVNLSEGVNTVTISASDSSGNKSENSYKITYTAKAQEIPVGDKPNVLIPSDNNDYKVSIAKDNSNKKITIEIPENKTGKTLIDLPANSSLPEISVVKGNVTALFPEGIQVTSGDSSKIELLKAKDITDTVLKSKVSNIVPDGQKLDSIVQAFSMGDGEAIQFNAYVTLTLKGMQGKQAAYIQNGSIHLIHKYSNDTEGLNSGKDEYAYDSGSDLIVKTKHFTDFIAYTTSDNGGGTTPKKKEYITLSVDKLTISKGDVISAEQVELQSGDTAWTLLQRELNRKGISCKYIWTAAYDSIYVQSIDGDGEFDHGSGSGWMYCVNGWYPNYGASKYTLKAGDKLMWRYTTNLGADLGEDLSKWTDSDKKDTTDGQKSGTSDRKNPVIEIPKDIQKDYTVNITKDYSDSNNITVNLPEVMTAKAILNLDAVKGSIPKITAIKGSTSLIIDKDTQIKSGNSSIELFTGIDTNNTNIIQLVKDNLNSNTTFDKINIAYDMGSADAGILFDRPVTLIFKAGQGQCAGFIKDNKFTAVKIYDTEEQGAEAVKNDEMKTYAFVKDNALYIKTNHFTTFVLYTVKEINPQSVYTDADKISSWAYQAVTEATQKGFVDTINGKFNPKTKITRAEFIKLMVSVLGLNTDSKKVIKYTDVTKKDSFYPYINAAYKAGLIKENGKKFNPNKTITREQVAAMIARGLKLKTIKPAAAIKDISKVADSYQSYVKTVVALGLMDEDNSQFKPKGSVTREKATVFAMKVYAYKNGEYTKSSGVDSYIQETGALMQKNVTDPVVASIGGEWTVLSLARSGIKVPASYYQKYYKNVENKLKETNGELHSIKYTEYDRVILALSSIGKDVTNVNGYNLTIPLADFNTVIKQGLNGPIWALIALDSKNYQIPADKNVKVQTTREMLVDYILSKEIAGGGWSLTSEAPADTDITAMALQALSKYRKDEKVEAAIDRAISFLAAEQQKDGSFKSSWGNDTNCESTAQVIVALTSLNINPRKDKRFVKNGNDAITALLKFYVNGGGFRHTLKGEPDAMATDQGMYALVAYNRFANGKKQLYDMTDVN